MKLALGLMLLLARPTPGPINATPAGGPAGGNALADLRPLEVRLRKLHLVRPDLQRFPIPYDTVC